MRSLTDKAGVVAAIIVLGGAIGTVICGMLSDRLGRERADRKTSLAIAFCLGSCLLLSAAFAIPTGTAIKLLCLGIFIVIGTNGPSIRRSQI